MQELNADLGIAVANPSPDDTMTYIVDGRALVPDDQQARAMRVFGRVMAMAHQLGYKVNPQLRRELFARAGALRSRAFQFQAPRCDRAVANVLVRIQRAAMN